MDKLSPTRRTENMRRIRSRNTRPELTVRRILSVARVHFKIHRRNLPGRPDVAIGRIRLAVFVHGCFWHQHPGCPRAFIPSSHKAFWTTKFRANAARDTRALAHLEEIGWRSQVIWECETKNEKELKNRLKPAILAYRKSNR